MLTCKFTETVIIYIVEIWDRLLYRMYLLEKKPILMCYGIYLVSYFRIVYVL